MADDEATTYIDELADRAGGAEPAFGGRVAEPPPTLDAARRLLDEAWEHSAAGTDLPDGARMRQVKRAALLAMRPVTSHQVQFNQQVSVAVKELAGAVEALSRRVDGADRMVDTATARVHATLATAELALDDLTDTVATLSEAVAALGSTVERLAEQADDLRGENRALRARQDLVLRTARDALGGGKAERKRLAALAREVDASAELLADDLADATRGSRDEVTAELAPFVADVELAGGGPVVDLAPGRGEWLDLLAARSVDSYGVDPSERRVRRLRRRKLDVVEADPIAHLAELPESSVGVVCAFGLVERLGTDALLELVDRSLTTLRPGGLLLCTAANPTALDVGAAEVWLDPARRRPLHPDLLELLVLDRGFAEAEIRWLARRDDADQLRVDDFPGVDLGRAHTLADRLNRVLAGPRRYAVVARKPGGA